MAKQEKSSKGKVSKLSSSPSKSPKGASVASKPASAGKKASRKQ